MPLHHADLRLLSSNMHALAMPSLVAIYAPIDEARVEQVGTGICFDFNTRQFLVTARHTLFGHDDDENPGDKAFFASGRLRQIGDLIAPSIFSSPVFDLAAVELTGDEKRAGLAHTHLRAISERPTFVTICGYLVRDFRRQTSEGMLAPKPFIYSNYSVAMPHGLIGLRYPKRRNRDTTTRRLVMTPTPRGLSGGPMLDSVGLIKGKLNIVGIFTSKPNGEGIAFGEVSLKVLAMLQVASEQL